MMSWFVPHTNLRLGLGPVSDEQLKVDLAECEPGSECCADLSDIYYEPWYSSRFKNIDEVIKYWKMN